MQSNSAIAPLEIPSLNLLSKLLQKIPLVRGKTRLARLLVRRYLKHRNVVVHSRLGHRYLVPHLNESVAYQILINGGHEPNTQRALQLLMPSDGTFIDVGANIGYFTLTLAALNPRARVFAIEASPRIARYLERNITESVLTNINRIDCALMDCDDQIIKFYEASPAQFGRGSVSPTEWNDATETTTVTLDSLMERHRVERVDVIKMDIQGAEFFALRGADKTLSRSIAPAIVFEFDEVEERATPGIRVGDAQRLLRDHGYTLWKLDDWLYGKPPLSSIFENGFCNLLARKPVAG